MPEPLDAGPRAGVGLSFWHEMLERSVREVPDAAPGLQLGVALDGQVVVLALGLRVRDRPARARLCGRGRLVLVRVHADFAAGPGAPERPFGTSADPLEGFDEQPPTLGGAAPGS